MPLSERGQLEIAVENAIKERVEKIVKEEAEAAAARVQKRVIEAAAIIGARVSERYTFGYEGRVLTIKFDTSALNHPFGGQPK